MRKAAAALSLLLLASISASARGRGAAASADHRGQAPALALFVAAVSPETPGFSLAGSAGHPRAAGPPSLDLQEPGPPAAAESLPEVPAPKVAREAAAPHLAVSVFLGRGGKDIFSMLHGQYTWRVLSRSMTVGVGLYREIPLAKGVGLLPYVGVIRASATLRPADLYGNRESYAYELTAFCVGLPLVIRFR
jgi:hypothetical protein